MTLRGNPTVISQMTSPGNSITTETNYYNILGELIQSVDGKGNPTNFDYTDSWNDSLCLPNPVFAYPTTVTNALGQVTKTTFNSCDGTVGSVRDQNDINASRAGTVYTYDGLQHVTNTSFPDGGTTQVNYGNTTTPEIITTTITATPDPNRVSTTTLDGLGRVANVVGPNGATVTVTYDSHGRVYTVSNPYFGTADSTYGTTYFYDALNRKTIQKQPDNTTLQWCYDDVKTTTGQTNCSSNQSTTTTGSWIDYSDESGRHWQYTNDALGRLTKVFENDPGGSGALSLETDHTYDALNNLVSVNQIGNPSQGDVPRARGFIYDGLSRLTSATNPESGTTTYVYANPSGGFCSGDTSNVCSRTDARGVMTSYTYDALNRMTSKSYQNTPQNVPNGTPSTCFLYDTYGSSPPPNAIGLLTAEWTQNGACPGNATSLPTSGLLTAKIVTSYDAIGRLLTQQTCVSNNCTQSSYRSQTFTYNTAGNLSGFNDGWGLQSFGQSYDGAGRLQFLTSSWVDSTHPQVLYGAQNYGAFGVTNAVMGDHLTITKTYDPRERVTKLTGVQQ